MADTIKVSGELFYSKNEEGAFLGNTSTKTITGTIERQFEMNPDIPDDTWTQLALPSIEAPFWVALRNNNTSQFVIIADNNSGDGLKIYLPPAPSSGSGYTQVFLCDSTELWAYTPNTTVNISVLAVQPFID